MSKSGLCLYVQHYYLTHYNKTCQSLQANVLLPLSVFLNSLGLICYNPSNKSSDSEECMAKTKKRSSTQKSRTTSRKKVVPSRSTRVQPSRTTSRTIKQISPERKRDIAAVIITLVGIVTLISLLTSQTGIITKWWTELLGTVMGWGKYILPVALIIFGLWIFLRNSEKLPKLSTERIFGLVLFFINLLAWLHVFSQGDLGTAAAGQGGGYIGAGIKKLLIDTLGRPGMIIIISAWLVISIILIFDISVIDLTKSITSATKKMIDQSRVAKVQRTERSTVIGNRERTAYSSSETTAAVKTIEPLTETVVSHTPQSTPMTAGTDPSITLLQEKKRQWILPDPAKILKAPKVALVDDENDQHRARVIEESLRSFGAPAHVVEIKRGPTITLFGVEPDFVESRNGHTRVRVSRITSLADDLAMALQASRIRVQAPVPGKGYVGIEVPNREIAVVSLSEVISNQAFKNMTSPLKFALGKDVSGSSVVADLAAMPHLLIAGTTNSGKSVCINSILSCFLMTNTPDQLRLVLVDPKRVELTGYNGIPHLLAPVIVDADRVVGALQWMLREMDSRYHKFSQSGTRNIQEFNAWKITRKEEPIPYLLVVIDELADMMMLAPEETEKSLTRLAQLARATGIHLIIATQRPSTDILTGLIKANFPARIAFAVFSGTDSRVILDQQGAERLLGRGDMLFQAPDAAAPVRIQGTYVSDDELSGLASFWRIQAVNEDAPTRPSQPVAFASAQSTPFKQEPLWAELQKDPDEDPMTNEAIAMIRQEGRASISMLQRKFRIGYTRAARLVEAIERKGIIGAPDPQTQVREVLDYGTVGPPAED